MKHPNVFICIESTETKQDKLQCLTAKIMKWGPNIWLLDLSHYLSYWQSQSQQCQLSAPILWKTILNRVFTSNPNQKNQYRATYATSPWQALLLLAHMQTIHQFGFWSPQTTPGDTHYQHLSWDAWWPMVRRLSHHIEKSKTKGFKRPLFNQQCSRFKKSMDRLGLFAVKQSLRLNEKSIHRRYGKYLASIWQWTHHTHQTQIPGPSFPWKDWVFKTPSAIKRSLEPPLIAWDFLQPLLIKDLDLLCKKSCIQPNERACKIDWDILFDNHTAIRISIIFRHPHPLQSELGHHKTTLLQAYYSFSNRENRPAATAGQRLLCYEEPIISWRLTLREKLTLPVETLTLFENMTPNQTKEKDLLDLENSLPIPLYRYTHQTDWTPETSFAQTLTSPLSETDHSHRSLNATARQRPLFLYTTPSTLQAPPINTHFLETTMQKWWQSTQFQADIKPNMKAYKSAPDRHYFKHIDLKGNTHWVSKNRSGEWMTHGLFG